MKVLVNYRNHHHRTTGGAWQMQIAPIVQGIRVTAFLEAVPLYLLAEGANK